MSRPAVLALALAVLVGHGPVEVRTYASQAPEVTALDRQLDEADRLLEAREFAAAATLYDAALAEARARVADRQVARGLTGRADLQTRQRRYDAALPDAREALAIYERLDDRLGMARVAYISSLIEGGSGRRDAAKAMADRSMTLYASLGDRAGEARAGLRVADLETDLADIARVVDRAVAAAREAGDLKTAGRALHHLGDQQFLAERYEEALATLLLAAGMFRQAGETLDLGTVHNSLGRVYRAHGRLDEALKQQETALALHADVSTANTRLLRVQSLNAVAVTYQRRGDYQKARDYLEQALRLAPQVELPRAQDFLQANMATVLAQLGQLETAAETMRQVLARGTDVFPALRWSQLADTYNSMERYGDALDAAQRSLALCGNERSVCAGAYSVRSVAEARLGQLEAARADMAKALELLEELRAQLVPADFFRQNFHRYYADAYTASIGLHLDAGDATLAIETAEQARSRAFLDLLRSRSLEAPPPAVTAAASLTFRGDGPARERRSAVQATPARVADLTHTAQRLGSSMVAYWVGTGQTFVWVIDGTGKLTSHRIAVTRARLERLVRETAPFADAARSPGDTPTTLVTRGAAPLTLTSGDAAWRELYTLLIAPIRQALPPTPGALLTIVPHDVLSSLSFAALRSPRGRYLLEDYTLHYAPAGAMFKYTEAFRRPDARTASMLMVADPVPPRRSTLDAPLPRLPGARAEAAAITRQVRMGRVATLADTSATEARVRDQVKDFAVLHFATHAVVRDEQPFSSFIALGASGAGLAADGILTAEDVYGLQLHADLVVLSACRSAAGSVGGDAIAALARAFLYAGTASLVASVWDVADEPTNRLVPAFYRAWLAGAGKAVALRRAQLALLADLRAGRVQVSTPLGPVAVPEHPVFWAGFALFGEP